MKSILNRKRKFDVRKKFGDKKKPSQLHNEEITELENKISKFDVSKATNFTDFPLCSKTLKGLEERKFVVPTVIQKKSLIPTLKGEDILGAAKTGSGKTLAFIIPILEKLHKLKWSSIDGVGALIISPTRELAYQTFEVLKAVGKYHEFSAGLVIGGKMMNEESIFINNTNIIVSTPGRLLHHMDQTPGFILDHLLILVLDEADRMLDLGFERDLNAILENLPSERQTLLFSATQTRSVKDIARLNMKNWLLLSDFEVCQNSTPDQLQQSYVVCRAEEKFDFIWSFVKSHLKSKVLIFLSSCKQVRFVHDVFCRLRPGITVLALHGAMQQMKRLAIYQSFITKQFVVLFATDIAARGLDFPSVNWVVQLDCPEDSNTYIHRAGRTARYEKDGEALLVLLPSEEEGMLKQLKEKKVPIEKINVNPKKLQSVKGKLESLCASDVNLKQFSQRAFVSYLKSICLMANKEVFDVTKIDFDAYSNSLGLAVTPRVRFIKKHGKSLLPNNNQKKEKFSNLPASAKNSSNKNKPSNKILDNNSIESVSNDEELNEIPNSDVSDANSSDESLSVDDHSDTSDSDIENSKSETNYKYVKNKRNVSENNNETLKQTVNFEENSDSNSSSYGEIMVKKRSGILDLEDKTETSFKLADEEFQNQTMNKKNKVLTKYQAAKKKMKKSMKLNVKVLYDDDGKPLDMQKAMIFEEKVDKGGINIAERKKLMIEQDLLDRKLYKEKLIKEKRERKLKLKKNKQEENLKKKMKFQNKEDDNENEQRFVVGSGDEFNEYEMSLKINTEDSDDNSKIEKKIQKRTLKKKILKKKIK